MSLTILVLKINFFLAGGNGITSPNAVGVLQWVPRCDNAAFFALDKVNEKKKKLKQINTFFSGISHSKTILFFIFYLYYFY